MPADVSIKVLAERVRDLRGWRRRAAAFAAGAVSVLAMAPFFAWPVLWITLSAAEWLRGHVLSGFPWNTLGYALTFPLALTQSAAILGIYGLTLVAVLVFALPPVLWSDAPAGVTGRRVRAAALAAALVPAAM